MTGIIHWNNYRWRDSYLDIVYRGRFVVMDKTLLTVEKKIWQDLQ